MQVNLGLDQAHHQDFSRKISKTSAECIDGSDNYLKSFQYDSKEFLVE